MIRSVATHATIYRDSTSYLAVFSCHSGPVKLDHFAAIRRAGPPDMDTFNRHWRTNMRAWSIGGFIVASVFSAVAVRAVPARVDFEAFPAMSSYIHGTPVPVASRLSNQYVSTIGVQFSSTSPY